eukprot:GHVR01166397.1.p1 GENE.GHVR01166397.1~~GHVR01166397.1.p1  ORF type:complete len:321 (-),score=60.25 GHVR01166397.1:34-996(-)
MMDSFEEPYGHSLTDLYFLYRRKNNLKEFLNEPTMDYSDLTAERRFKTIDMILIAATPNTLPWTTSYSQVACLVRMALRWNTPLFCESSAMHSLVSAASVGATRIEVINKKHDNGEDIADVLRMPRARKLELKHYDFFVQYSTGDLYTKSEEFHQWQPRLSVGIHSIRHANQVNSDGARVVAPPLSTQDRVPSQLRAMGPFMGLCLSDRKFEAVVRVHTDRSTCFLMKNTPTRFTVPARSFWQVNYTIRKPFEVIASSIKGPEIVHVGPCVGVQFQLDSRYPETLTIFSNFIKKFAAAIQGGALTHTHTHTHENISVITL